MSQLAGFAAVADSLTPRTQMLWRRLQARAAHRSIRLYILRKPAHIGVVGSCFGHANRGAVQRSVAARTTNKRGVAVETSAAMATLHEVNAHTHTWAEQRYRLHLRE